MFFCIFHLLLILLIRSIGIHDTTRIKFAGLIFGVITLLIVLLITLLPVILDSSIIEFGINKIKDMHGASASGKDESFLLDRFEFINNINFRGITFFGDGIGHYASKILDNMWLTIFTESGIWGLFVYISIFLCVAKKGFKNLNLNLFELGILGMYVIAMFGANSLVKNTHHAIVLWLCCGRIYNIYCLKFKKNNIHIK